MDEPVTKLQCPCGAVRLHLTGAPVVQFYCHCDDCQVVAGAPLISVAMWPIEKMRIDGEIERWALKTLPRSRCRVCGKVLFATPLGFGVHGVSATMLPAEMFRPQFHIFCEFATIKVQDDLPHFRFLPTALVPAAQGGSDNTVDW